jgi:hypothetical protein
MPKPYKRSGAMGSFLLEKGLDSLVALFLRLLMG